MAKVYRVLRGFNYGPDDTRHEPGEEGVELPAQVASELVAQGAVEVQQPQRKRRGVEAGGDA